MCATVRLCPIAVRDADIGIRLGQQQVDGVSAGVGATADKAVLDAMRAAGFAPPIDDADACGSDTALQRTVTYRRSDSGAALTHNATALTGSIDGGLHLAVMDGVCAALGDAHDACAVVTASDRARCPQVPDGGSADISERCRAVVRIAETEIERMACTVEGATERMLSRAHHFRDIDVGTQQHGLTLIRVSSVHALGKGLPVGIRVDEEEGEIGPFHDIRLARLDACGILEVQRQRAVAVICRTECIHRSALERRTREVVHVERHRQCVPFAVAVECAAVKRREDSHVVELADGIRVVGIIGQCEGGV